MFGARRTGKTVLMETIINEIDDKESLLYLIGENLDTTEILASKKLSRINQMLKGKKYLFIDEAQKIPDIGEILKLIVDTNKQIKIMITGSSAFDLKSHIGKPLTGRSKFFYLYPFSQLELKEDWLTYKITLEEKLIYGMYPQVITASSIEEKKMFLNL